MEGKSERELRGQNRKGLDQAKKTKRGKAGHHYAIGMSKNREKMMQKAFEKNEKKSKPVTD